MSVTEQELWNFVDGADGTGMSPYDIWLSLGNEGTAQDFLNYLRGGTDGASPYEIWKSIYGGTQQEYLNFLRGEGMSVIDNLESNSATHSLSARQGKVLKNNRIVSLDEIDLVTEEGFFADALSVKELKETLINGIVDNLLSTATNLPLSAKQGKVLKASIDELNSNLGYAYFSNRSINNIDNAIGYDKNGIYWINTNEIAGSHPFTGYYFLSIISHIIGNTLQIAYRFDDGKIYTRMYLNSMWYEWSEFYTREEIDSKRKISYYTGIIEAVGDSSLDISLPAEHSVVWIDTTVASGNFPEGCGQFCILETIGGYNVLQRLTSFASDGNYKVYTRIYANNYWYPWGKIN